MTRIALAALLLTALPLTSCSPRAPRIAVQLVTDYVPIRDFDAITVSFPGGTQTVAAASDRSYGRAVRVTELELPSADRVMLTLTLLSHDAVVQAQPRTVVPITGETTVTTFLITRDCGGVMCPGASDADAIACVGGLCVDPACSPEHPELCPTCAGGCTASAIACVVNACRPEGVCFASSDDSLCPAGQVCVSDEGCRDLSADAGMLADASREDADLPDASVSLVDGGAVDTGPMPDAAVVCLPGAVRFDEYGGGTPESPYLLCTDAQWESFATIGDQAASYRLDADLTAATSAAGFSGLFDGNTHTLSGLSRRGSLFGAVTGGMIERLRVEIGVDPGPPTDDVGVLASVATGTIFDQIQIQVSSAIVYGRARVGGIAGTCIDCQITDSVVSIDRLVGDSDVGLVAGRVVRGFIRRVSVVSLQLETHGTTDCVRAGGIAGTADSVTIEECDASVQMFPFGVGGYGGIAGSLEGAGWISDVRVLGRIPPAPDTSLCVGSIGGIAGVVSGPSTIRHALVDADVAEGGGLVGDWIGTGNVVESVVVGAHPGFPNVFFSRCPAGAMLNGLHYFDDGTPMSSGVPCAPPDLGHIDPAYFNDPANPPLDTWNFGVIWSVGTTTAVPFLLRAPPVL
jgi:hypothetical protein